VELIQLEQLCLENTGGTFNVTGLVQAQLKYLLLVEHTDGTATFRNNTGGTFNVIGLVR
jgi:hypothetical protein